MPRSLAIQHDHLHSQSDSAHREPSRKQRVIDRLFVGMCRCAAWLALLLVLVIALQIGLEALPAMRTHGLSFLTGTVWDSNKKTFAILPEIWGTVYTSVLALGIGTGFGLAVAIFLSEGFLGGLVHGTLKALRLEHRRFWQRLPDQADRVLRNLIELLAAIPSVVYGLWGIFVVIPFIRPFGEWLHAHLGWIPLFRTPFSGPSVLPAVIVLSIMILPTITALSREALAAVPQRLQVASYGMGATRWETILAVLIPSAGRGILGAILLAFGRALGETMALAMLVGNSNRIDLSLFAPANTLAALLANNFPEATAEQVPVLMYAAVALLTITFMVNVVGAALISRAVTERGAR